MTYALTGIFAAFALSRASAKSPFVSSGLRLWTRVKRREGCTPDGLCPLVLRIYDQPALDLHVIEGDDVKAEGDLDIAPNTATLM